jgi:hypothetical protein
MTISEHKKGMVWCPTCKSTRVVPQLSGFMGRTVKELKVASPFVWKRGHVILLVGEVDDQPGRPRDERAMDKSIREAAGR